MKQSSSHSSFNRSFKKSHSRKSWWRHFLKRWHLDPLLSGLLLLLSAIGCVILYSASDMDKHMVMHQLAHIGLAWAVLIAIAQVPPQQLKQWAPLLYALGIILLLAVLFVGHVDNGARRWLNLGGFHLQPSELMKLFTPMMLAFHFDQIKRIPSARDNIIACILIAIPTVLTMKQPDLGTAIIIASSALWVFFLSGLSRRTLLFASGASIVAIPFSWHFLHSYQKARIMTFLNPETDPLGNGYHIIQSKIAIGSGGFLGKGWLHGTQSHLNFLPEHTTDFIFSVFSEEWGLIGSILLIALFFAIFYRCMVTAQHQKDHFSRLLCAALATSFLFAALVNMGMVTGLLPVVGVPLPFISYGGSVMLSQAASFAMIMSMRAHKRMW